MINLNTCILEQPNIDFDKWQVLVNMMAEIYGASSGVVVQFRNDSFNVVSASNNEGSFLEVNASWPWEMKSFCRRIMETRSVLYVNDAENSDEWCSAPPVCEGPVRSYLGYPLFWPDNSLFGSICVIDTTPSDYSESFVKLLGQLKKVIESELQHVFDHERITKLLEEQSEQQEQLKQLALYDSLTGCANRNFLSERIAFSIARSEREKSEFSLLYMDLNKFKAINDTHGHKAGDQVLMVVASRINGAIRRTDLVARVGGDEFVIVFNNLVSSEDIINLLSDKILEPISFNGVNLQVSATFGVSVYPEDGGNMDKLLDIADKRMYYQKLKARA